MHQAVHEWVFPAFHKWRNERTHLDVLEIGSLDMNGSIKTVFAPFAQKYVGIDMQEGPNVDVIASGESYWALESFDVVVACEVFEHTPKWKDIIKQSWINLRPGGLFIATMAGEGRAVHSGVDGGVAREWEHYANIGAWELNQALFMFKFKEINYLNADLRCYAVK